MYYSYTERVRVCSTHTSRLTYRLTQNSVKKANHCGSELSLSFRIPDILGWLAKDSSQEHQLQTPNVSFINIFSISF